MKGKEKMSEKSNDSKSSNLIWMHRNIDPMELVEKEKWKELTEYAEDNMEMLTRKFVSNADDLADSVRAGAIGLNVIDAMLMDKEMAKAIYEIGKLKGMIELMARKISHDSQKKEEEFLTELKTRINI